MNEQQMNMAYGRMLLLTPSDGEVWSPLMTSGLEMERISEVNHGALQLQRPYVATI